MILIRPVTPTAAMVLRSRRTRSRIPTAPGIPTALVAPPIPMAVACRLKGGRFGCRRNILEEKRGGGTFKNFQARFPGTMRVEEQILYWNKGQRDTSTEVNQITR